MDARGIEASSRDVAWSAECSARNRAETEVEDSEAQAQVVCVVNMAHCITLARPRDQAGLCPKRSSAKHVTRL